MSGRKKTRIRSTIDELPEDIKELINKRLADVSYTYVEIAEELSEIGFAISRSAVGRYALRMGAALKRMKEANDQTKVLIEMVKENPNSDFSEAGLQMLMDSLINKIAIAQEDIDCMDIDKAGRLMVAIARTEVYRKKIKSELNKQYLKALEEVKEELRSELQNNPEVLKMLIDITNRMAEKFEGIENG